GRCRQLCQVSRIIDIECDSWKRKNGAWKAGGFGGQQMWLETVVAETQREKGSRRPKDGIRAASIRSGNQDCTLFRRCIKDLLKFGSLNQRNVTRDHHGALDAACLAKGGSHLDGVGFAPVLVIRDDIEIKDAGQFARETIAGHHCDLRTISPPSQRC